MIFNWKGRRILFFENNLFGISKHSLLSIYMSGRQLQCSRVGSEMLSNDPCEVTFLPFYWLQCFPSCCCIHCPGKVWDISMYKSGREQEIECFFPLGCPCCTQWLTSDSICPNRLLLVVFRGPFVVLVPAIEPRWVATKISPLSPVLFFWPDIIRFVFASSEHEVAWSVSNFILKVNCVFFVTIFKNIMHGLEK